MMKKVLSVLLALTFIFSAVPLSGVADLVKGIDWSFLAVQSNAASAGDLSFELNADGKSYYVSACGGSASGELLIPSTYNGKPVTHIGEYAFEYCIWLTSITIPNSVTSIGYAAFLDCESLTSITIPDSVTSIGWEAFANTGYYDNYSNWENNVLYNGNHLIEARSCIYGNYEIKPGTKTIANFAFSYCDSLTSINIPDSVTSIGEEAFCYCTSLTSITIPDSVTSIGAYAFEDCTSLTSITIPDSVTSIGEWAFDGCSYLTIYCNEGEYAHLYAVNNSIPYILLCKHQNTANKTKVSATCTQNGVTAGVYCNDCKQYISGGEVIPAAHNYKNGVCTVCKDWQYKNTVLSLGKVTNQNGSVKLTWSTVTGATGYIVYRKAGSATSWSKLATVTTLTYTDKNVKTGTKYTYTVKPICGSVSGKYNTTGISTYYLAQPTVKAANQNGSVKVSWGKITGAKSYIVYRKAGSATKWTKVATVTTNTYTDKSVKSGTNYTYTVKAVNGSYVSAYNTKGVVTKYLAQPTLGTPVSAKAGVTVKWGKVTGATGYIVYRKTGSGSYAKIASVKGNTKVSYLDKSAKKGTTYTYTVKAYYSSYYSAYNSKGVSIKDKY